MNEHLGGCHFDKADGNTWMPDVWTYLIEKYGIKSVLDVGAGCGYNAAWFHEKGLYTIAVEGFEEAIQKTKMPLQRVVFHDYTHGPLHFPAKVISHALGNSLIPGTTELTHTIPPDSRAFDLCWSSEFVEHVEEKFIGNYAASFQACRYLCMTYALPGQTGHHHVCEREEAFWVKAMEGYGFKLDRKETDYLRSTDVHKAPWGRKSLTFFRNAKLTPA